MKKNTQPPKERIAEQKITDTLEWNYMPYAMSVIVSRAIPEIDGLKPSHRKLLYTMYQMGLQKGDRTKSSNVVGQTMKLNPHGDGAIYETLVRLTEGNEALLLPFVDSKGNFGKQYSRDMAYAAPRYTEVKLAAVCSELFADIDKDTVDFIDNYDGKMKEPLLLPTTFPNILVNPNLGIAVGMASAFCGFPLTEVCETTIRFLKDETMDLLPTLLGPDFSTGGEMICQEKELRSIYETGRGSIRVRAKAWFDAKNHCIEVYEIPYTTNIEAIIDKIIALVKSGKLKDITDVRDETDLHGLKIAIDVKRNTNHDLLLHKLYTMTPLSDSFSCNFNLLIEGRPMTLGVRGILKEWVRFRITSIRRSLTYDIAQKTKKLHLLEGLAKILLDIDRAIAIIRHTKQEAEVVPNLMDGFFIDEIQAEYIAEIKLRNINQEYILRRLEERESLKEEIASLQAMLESEQKIKAHIAGQLRAVAKKYGKPRKTTIVPEEELVPVPEEVLVEDYPVQFFLTEQNYFKKIPLSSMRSAGEQKLKEEDWILQSEQGTNRSELLFFSDRHQVYKMRAHEIPDMKASGMGEYLLNLLSMEQGERILYMTSVLEYAGHMLFVFANGKVAKVALSGYETKVNRKKLLHAYSDKSPLVFMTRLSEDTEVLLIRSDEKAMLLDTSLVPAHSTKNAAGVQVFTLKKNSALTGAFLRSDFASEQMEHYRAKKIPFAGHFLTEEDKAINSLSGQQRLI